jgi:hypothetical protein
MGTDVSLQVHRSSLLKWYLSNRICYFICHPKEVQLYLCFRHMKRVKFCDIHWQTHLQWSRNFFGR